MEQYRGVANDSFQGEIQMGHPIPPLSLSASAASSFSAWSFNFMAHFIRVKRQSETEGNGGFIMLDT